MSNSDQTEEARRLLDKYQYEINQEFNADNRPELVARIAAALAARDEKIAAQARIIDQYQKGEDRINELNGAMEAEIAALKVELKTVLADLYAERRQ